MTAALFIEPSAPWQNAFVESFNSRIRHDLLSSEVFESLAEAVSLLGRWRFDYSPRDRSVGLPHSGLGLLTHEGFASFSQRFEVAIYILGTKLSPLEAGSDLGSN